MIDFKSIIESFLNSKWTNSNQKEQNFQGRLYSFLLPLEQQGYCVEMESNVADEHLKDVIPASAEALGKLEKKEIDILVYKREGDTVVERYLAELKWIYHKDGPWNGTETIDEIIADSRFCQQMTSEQYGGFNETCSIVCYDFDEKKQVVRFSPKEDPDNNKYSFVGGCYETRLDNVCTLEPKGMNVRFRWKKPIAYINNDSTDYRYYIVSFRSKRSILNQMSEMVEDRYGFRPEKSINLVMISSWFRNLPKTISSESLNIGQGFVSICNDIDQDIIQ